MPMTLSGRLVAAPNLVIEIEPDGKHGDTETKIHQTQATQAPLDSRNSHFKTRTGVGGQNAVGWCDDRQLPKDCPFQFQILRHGLDDHIGRLECVQGIGVLNIAWAKQNKSNDRM